MFTRRRFLDLTLAAPLIVLSSRTAVAGSPEIFSIGKVAIQGYDPVAYFAEDRPVEGDLANQIKWMGAIWRFASRGNLAAFEMDPHRFAPRYGGYCAYGMAKGQVASTVPEAWTIHDGALFLNYSVAVRDLWRQDIPGHIAAADGNWPAALAG